ncbi:MAG: hypothetical protein ACP5G4_07000 [bacterium]
MEGYKMSNLRRKSISAEEKRRIEESMKNGYYSTSEEDKEINRDWEPADLENWD